MQARLPLSTTAAIAALSFCFFSCSTPDTTPPLSEPVQTPSPRAAKIAVPTDSSPRISPFYLQLSLSGIEIKALVFDSRSHYLMLVDQADGPASVWPDSRAAGRANSSLAAINAGFFTPDGKPLGRVVTPKHSAGSINRASSLGSGLYLERDDGSMALIRREQFESARQALQSGPFLIENGSRVGGLSTKKSSARSFLATDGKSRWLIARSSACSLAQLASALEHQNIGGFTIATALNLDGGRSSELWVSGKVTGGPAFERPFWNRPVRNFLLLKPRP